MPKPFLALGLAVTAALFAFLPPGQGGEDPDPTAFWGELAGWEEEGRAESLELRDELVTANLTFMSAMAKAIAQAESLSVGDSRRPLAWARVEYLAETSFRMLSDTGEYAAFLAATEPAETLEVEDLTPLLPGSESQWEALSGGESEDDLVFETLDGQPLSPFTLNGRPVLVRAGDVVGEAVGESQIRAHSSHIASGPDVSVPLVRSRLAWLRAMTRERLGETELARREVRTLGMVRDWLLLGPLDFDQEFFSPASLGLDDFLGILDSDFSLAGKNGSVHWRPFHSDDPLGRLPLGAALGKEPTTALALTLVYSPHNQAAVIRYGSSGRSSLWVNHIRANNSGPHRLANPGQDVFDVWLRQGWNLILVRNQSAAADWRLTLRIVSPDGSPFQGGVADFLNASHDDMELLLLAARQVVEHSRFDQYFQPEVESELGGLSALSRQLVERPQDFRSGFYLAFLLASRHMMEGLERFDRELIFRRVVDLSSHYPYFILMAARSMEAGVEGPDREENLRLALLKMAAGGDSPAAMVDIGRLYLDVMRQPRRAGEFANQALASNPMSLRGMILLHDVAVDRDWKAQAGTLLDRLRRRHPAAAAVRLRTGRAALQRGRYRTAYAEFQALLALDADNHEALTGIVTALGRLGETSTARELLERRVGASPYDFWARLALARHYRDAGDNEGALRVVQEALAINPNDQETLVVRNELVRERTPPPSTRSHSLPGFIDAVNPAILEERSPPPGGWEYLYFHLEDRMDRNGSLDRVVSFGLKVYNETAARLVRDLGLRLDVWMENGTVENLTLVGPDGRREDLAPQPAHEREKGLAFRLPPLTAGMSVLARISLHRAKLDFLADYFGLVVPLGQPVPVRLSRYVFTAPRESRLYFRPANGAPRAMEPPGGPESQERTYIWEMQDLPAYVDEPYGPGRYSRMPYIQVSSLRDWNEFSRWYWRLINTQYHTPPELRFLVRRLAGGRENASPLTQLDRAAAWVAENLSHRNWEFGAYAFRPLSVRAILSRRAADTKDRTLLLCLLAHEYQFSATPVLTRSWESRGGVPELEADSLPLLDYFNYSLAAVDTGEGGEVFFDPSSPNRPPAVMPAALFAAPAIRLDPEGATLIRIPDAGVEGCVWEEVAEAVVDPMGNLVWEETLRGQGTAAEALRQKFGRTENPVAAWETFLDSEGGLARAASAELAENPASPASVTFTGRSELVDFANHGQGRMLLPLPPLPGRVDRQRMRREFPLSLGYLAAYAERQENLSLPQAFRLERRIGVNYPPDWHLVNPPQEREEDYPFGKLRVKVALSSGRVDLDYRLEVTNREIAPGDFPDFRRLAALAERWTRPLLLWETP
ncbi:MAG: DUF3858 domain-containing protein [Planctomycetota bacterium]|jgi:tetratricopeptide (TPR) repeat protein|nr:DUF3858 domain-containing protein [Planctomycetota bacterium]